MRSIPELLAPAGNREALEAALCNGADAVYLGSALFGARSSAGFDADALRDAVRFAHLYRKRIYVTVNTLVKQSELSSVRDTCRLLQDIQADAVLVQDAGILRIIKNEYPLLAVHASTQMSIHNAVGARFLLKNGVNRVVLARECSIEAIRDVARTGIETEVFIHGALCASVSGQCQFSAMLGGRSGNRGHCAQPCRLSYIYRGRTGAWLSPRDLCLRDDLPLLLDAGVSSLKIEGRLKRPEYAAVVTRSYRDAIDAIMEGRYAPACPEELNGLKQVFHRGGFTRGYAAGGQDADIINPCSVSHEGLPLGSVIKAYQKNGINLCDVRLIRDLHNGDGLRASGQDGQEIIYSGQDVRAGGTATLRLHKKIKAGCSIFTLADEKQLSLARKSWENGMPKIPFDAVLSAYPGQKSRLTVSNKALSASVEGDTAQPAQSNPLDTESTKRLVAKAGGTPFVLRSFQFEGEGAYLPTASLNALRRTALEALSETLIASHVPPVPLVREKSIIAGHATGNRRLFARSADARSLNAFLNAGADTVIYAPNDYTKEYLQRELPFLPENSIFSLPVQACDDTMAMLFTLAEEHGLDVAAGSIGQLGWTQARIVMTGEGIPVWNSEAISFLAEHGCKWQVLSRELSKNEIIQLPETSANLVLPVYGRGRLMLLNHCPERTFKGCDSRRESCNMCSAGTGLQDQALTDRLGFSYPLIPVRLPEGCLTAMLGALPLNLGIKAAEMSWLVDFTNEDITGCIRITRYYRAIMDRNPCPEPYIQGTMGRYASGVE